jgi:hypothetical protein
MFKMLALIGLILAENAFAPQIADESLETIEKRIVWVSAFEMTAHLASLEDADRDRERLNTSLISQFEETKAHSFLELKTIETRGEAIDAWNYYKHAKDNLSELRTELIKQKFSVPTDK